MVESDRTPHSRNVRAAHQFRNDRPKDENVKGEGVVVDHNFKSVACPTTPSLYVQ